MIRHRRSEYESKIADNLYQKWGARIGEVDHGAMLTELTDYGIEIAKSSMTTSEFITWLEWKLPRKKQPIHHKPISPIHAEQIQLL